MHLISRDIPQISLSGRWRAARIARAPAHLRAPSRQQVLAHANLFSKLFGGRGGEADQRPQQQQQQKQAPAEAFIMSENTAKPEFPPYSVVKRGPIYDLRWGWHHRPGLLWRF